MNYTNGPWKIGKNRELIFSAENEPICHCFNKRDVGLIGACTLLYEALKDCLSENGLTVEQSIDGVPLQQWEINARKAIAKAEGRTEE